jgi:hypothetical protein
MKFFHVTKLELAGYILVAAGVTCLQMHTRNETLQEVKDATVWTEADKEVIGESNSPAS